MNIRKLSFAVIAGLALASSTTVIADGHARSMKDKAESHVTSKLETLGLSEEQKLSVQAIKDRYQPQLDALNNSKMALKDQHAALDTASPDYAEQSLFLENQIQQISQEKSVLKMQMKEETEQVLTPDQRLMLNETPQLEK